MNLDVSYHCKKCYKPSSERHRAGLSETNEPSSERHRAGLSETNDPKIDGTDIIEFKKFNYDEHIKNIKNKYNILFDIKHKEKLCSGYVRGAKCKNTNISYVTLSDDTYDLCKVCYNNLENNTKKYFNKLIHTLPPKIHYEIPHDVIEIEPECTRYYKIYYEFTDEQNKTYTYVLHYLNYCCDTFDKLFSKNINKNTIIDLLTKNILCEQITRDMLCDMWWSKEMN